MGEAHGKIILIGEHSVVYGYPAIAVPLKNITVKCRIEKSRNKFSHNEKDPLSTAVYTALKHLRKTGERIKYIVDSEIPSKRGMGSSAAVSIAAVRAVFEYYGKELDSGLLEKLVNEAEIVAHTKPSGLDAKTCMSSKAVKFEKNTGFSNIDMDLNAFLVIADTGIYGNTGEAVRKVAELGEKAEPVLKNLGRLAVETEKYINRKNIEEIGKRMILAHSDLKKLGVSIEKSDELVEEAMKSGAAGAKMSGGGLGGCITALVKDYEKAVITAEKLREKGAVNTWIQKI